MMPEDPELGLRCLLCTKVGNNKLTYLGAVSSQIQAHQFCIKFAKSITNKRSVVGKTRLQNEVAETQQTICVFCKKPGAASGCWKPFCQVRFHLPCSLGREVVNRHDIFMSSCWPHTKPQVDVPGHHRCGVCGWAVERGVSFSSLVTSCCSSKHHRDCIQVLASLGQENCPSCGNGADYKTEMTVNGIYFKPVQPVLTNSLASLKQEELRAQQTTSPRILQESVCDSRDSGISLSSPLTSSTPINFAEKREKTKKRKSGSDLFSSVKRSKSLQDESGLNSSNIELRPRKIEENELEMEDDNDDDSVIIIDSENDNENVSEEDIEAPTPSESEERQLAIIPQGESELEDSYLDDSLGESFESCDESEFDLDDIKALEEDMSRSDSQENNSPQVIVGDLADRGSPGRDYILGNETTKDLPALCYNPSAESKTSVSRDKITQQRTRQHQQRMLKKITKRPLSERRILHGRHPLFLGWRQEEENYLESNTDWVEQQAEKRIDDFIDLNEGEMNFFKLWNSHLRSLQTLVGTHMPAVVLSFVESQGLKLLEQNLYRNFAAHLTALQKLNVVGADTILSAFSQLQKIMVSLALPDLQSSWQNMWSGRRSQLSTTSESPDLEGDQKNVNLPGPVGESFEEMPLLVDNSVGLKEGVLDVTPPMPLLEPERNRIAEDFHENSQNKFVKLRMKSGAKLLEKLSVKLKAKKEKKDSTMVRFNNKKDKRILSDFELEVRSKRKKNKCTRYPKSNRNPTRFYKICSEQ